MFKKIYIHKDLTERTEDRLRKVFGHVYYVHDYIPPLLPEGFSVDLSEKNSGGYVPPANQATLVFRTSYDNGTTFLHSSNNAMYEDIRTEGARGADATVVRGEIKRSTRHKDKYNAIHSIKNNPALAKKIDSTSLLPNVKIPLRIMASEEFQRGDKFWQTMFMGGKVGDTDYPKIIDQETIFYDFQFELTQHGPRYYWDHADASVGTIDPDRRTYSIVANYPNNNTYINNYQAWQASAEHELLLPSFLHEMGLRRDRWLRRRVYGGYYLYGRDWGIPAWGEVTREHLIDMYDESPNHIALLDYYYPQPSEKKPELMGIIKPSVPGDTWHDEPDTIKEFQSDESPYLKKDQYYGQKWIYNWSPSPELKQAVIKAQKNIILNNTFMYQNDFGNWEEQLNDSAKFSNTANIGHIMIQFDRQNGHNYYNYDVFTGGSSHSIATDRRMGRVSISSKHGQDRWFFRDSIQDNELETKFLKTLKDLEDGALPIKYEKSDFRVSTQKEHPIQAAKTLAYTTAEEKTVDDIKLECFDFFDFLAHIRDKPDSGIIDDYITMGARERIGGDLHSYSDTLLVRYGQNSNATKVLNDCIKNVREYFEYASPEYMYNFIRPETSDGEGSGYWGMTRWIGDHVVAGAPVDDNETPNRFNEVLAYKIEKSGGSATGESRTKNHLQNFWIWNRGTEVASLGTSLKTQIVDTQVKHGKEYTYTAYAYVAVIGHKYKYSDYRLTKLTNVYDIDEDGDKDFYCVKFYDPLSMVVRPQIYSISSTSGRNPRGMEFSNLAEYNSFATAEYDILTAPQCADLHLNVEPCVKVYKIPIFQKTVALHDNPGNKIAVVPFHVINDDNKIGFNIMQENFREALYPATISTHDRVLKEKYLYSKDLSPLQAITQFSESPPRYLEVYRIKEPPTSYSSFDGNLVSKIDLRIPGEKYNRTDYIFGDRIKSNQKYYYVFRYITENNMPGHLSTIIEAELVDDGGYKYANFDTFDTSRFIKNNFANKSKTFKKIFQLEPNMNQLTLDTTNADFKNRASAEINNVLVGHRAEKIWDKKFKIRLTSKKTGKKTDLNVGFKIRNKDFS